MLYKLKALNSQEWRPVHEAGTAQDRFAGICSGHGGCLLLGVVSEHRMALLSGSPQPAWTETQAVLALKPNNGV